MKNSMKASMVLILSLGLSACGGGDSDSGSGNTGGTGGGNTGGGNAGGGTPLTMTVNAPSETTDFSTVNVTVSLSGGSGTESVQASIYSVGKTGGNPEVTYTDNGFNIEIGAAAYSRERYRVNVTGRKGNDTKNDEFTLVVSNSTGDAWRDRALLINKLAPAQRMFIAEMAMIERLAKAVRMTGGDVDTKDLMPMYIDAMHKEEDILDAMYGAITWPLWIEQYMDGERSSTEAFGNLQKALSLDECEPSRCMNDYLVNIVPLFNYVIDQSQGAIARPSYGEVQFDNRTNTYSIFYVDGVNGSFDSNGNWSFNSELAYLSDLIVAGHEAAVEFTSGE